MKTVELINKFEEPIAVDVILLEDNKNVKLIFSNDPIERIFNYSTKGGKEKLCQFLANGFPEEECDKILAELT